jgi:hypothetical protein
MKPLQNKKFGLRRGAAKLSSAAYTPVCEQRKRAATKYQDKIRSFAEVSA